MLNRVWLPAPFLQQQIASTLSDVFANNYVIGFQLRYGTQWTKKHQSDNIYLDDDAYLDTLKFINCALQIENDYLAALAVSIKDSSTRAFKPFKWFVASDVESQVRKLANEYPDKVVTASGKIGHAHFEAEASMGRVVVDIELLSRCDELIITGGSTFGWMAAIKSLRRPYHVV